MIERRKRVSSEKGGYFLPNNFLCEVLIMKIERIRKIAEKKGINAGDMKRTELIRNIQRAERNSDLFCSKIDQRV